MNENEKVKRLTPQQLDILRLLGAVARMQERGFTYTATREGYFYAIVDEPSFPGVYVFDGSKLKHKIDGRGLIMLSMEL